MSDAPSYGQTRSIRSDVTYAQIERAATDILKTGTRPTVEGVKEALGGGSPRTITDGLNRYWRDLGNQIEGNPDTLRRLPAAVADLAEGLWQRALALAMDAAQATTTEAKSQLSRLQSQLEVRQHTLSQREIELDELLRSRERTVKELEANLRAALTMLTKREVTLASLQSRLSAAVAETGGYRLRLANVIGRAVAQHPRTAPKAVSKPRRASRVRSKVKKRGRPSAPRTRR